MKIFYDDMSIDALQQEQADLEAEISRLREISKSFEKCSRLSSLPFLVPMQLFAYINKRNALLEIIETRQNKESHEK